MSTLDELKKSWALEVPPTAELAPLAPAELSAITRTRSVRHVNQAMRYFWGSLALQIIVYGLLSHVFIRFWNAPLEQGVCVAGLLLYLPFTIVLLRQFKRVARFSPARTEAGFSLQARIEQQYHSLLAFYRFKRSYEFLLIPLSSGVGVWLLFRLYAPGGVLPHLAGAGVTYLLTLLACGWAIWQENRTHFEQPLRNLEALLAEFHA